MCRNIFIQSRYYTGVLEEKHGVNTTNGEAQGHSWFAADTTPILNGMDHDTPLLTA
jgi:hypothetical protein